MKDKTPFFMRHLANYLSASRIFLVPIPYALLLTRNWNLQLLAFILFIVLGVTDRLDGYLARRFGPTKLGSVLDNIADKIFVVFLFLPLGILQYIPLWMPVVILIRDPLVTGLRYLCSQTGTKKMEVEELGRYKTNYQIFGGCLIIAVWMIPDQLTVLALLSTLTLIFLALFLYCLRKKEQVMRYAAYFFSLALVVAVRYLCPIDVTALVFAWIVIFVTWLSALHYLTIFALECVANKIRFMLWLWTIVLLEHILFPLIILVLYGFKILPPGTPSFILFVEFLGATLNQILSSGKVIRNTGLVLFKIFLQYLFILLIIAKNWFLYLVPVPLRYSDQADGYILAAGTLLALIVFLVRHWPELVELTQEEGPVISA